MKTLSSVLSVAINAMLKQSNTESIRLYKLIIHKSEQMRKKCVFQNFLLEIKDHNPSELLLID